MISHDDFMFAHQHRTWITSFIQSRFTLQSFRISDELEDLTSDIVMKVALALPGFKDDRGADVRTWIGTIAINHVQSFLRRKGNKPQNFTTDEYVFDSLVDYHYLTPEEAFVKKESLSLLQHRLYELPQPQRQVIELLASDGDFSYEDIAEQTGQGLSAVKSIIYRVRTKMKKTA